jgi:DNA polymerase
MFLDTLSMANAVHGQTISKSLANLARHYELGAKGDEIIHALGKRRDDFTEEEWARYGEYCLNDCDLTFRLFQKLLPHFSQKELRLIDRTVRLFTEPSFVLDEPQMEEYQAYEIARKAELLDRVGEDKGVFMSNDKFAQLLIDHGVVPGKKWSSRKVRGTDNRESVETWAFAKTDSFMQGLLEHEDEEIRWLAEARVGVKSTINETRTQRFLTAGKGGRSMPVYLRYAAAHTHRWGGADGTNWQNLQRVNKSKPRSGTIRKSILAPKGKLLVVADSSQIEARMTAYLAREQWLIDAFAQGRDIYSEFATEAYGRPIDRKKNPADELPGFVGKVCVLGLGFGMGWEKFATTMLAGAIGGPPVTFGLQEYEQLGIDGSAFMNNPNKVERAEALLTRLPRDKKLLHCIVAEHFVKVYRAKNRQIAGKDGLWKHMELVIAWMNDGVECDAGLPVPLRVFRHGIQLPGFNAMHYPGLEYDGHEYSYLGGKSGKERVRLHGPAMTENVVQYLARCVVAEQVLEYVDINPVEHKIALLTHDEAVSCVPEYIAEQALEHKLRIMKTSPSWAPGLPLGAEGGLGRVYGEIK